MNIDLTKKEVDDLLDFIESDYCYGNGFGYYDKIVDKLYKVKKKFDKKKK